MNKTPSLGITSLGFRYRSCIDMTPRRKIFAVPQEVHQDRAHRSIERLKNLGYEGENLGRNGPSVDTAREVHSANSTFLESGAREHSTSTRVTSISGFTLITRNCGAPQISERKICECAIPRKRVRFTPPPSLFPLLRANMI